VIVECIENAHVARMAGCETDTVCTSADQFKAWSMNLGHEKLATSINSYRPVTEQRQPEIIAGMAAL
jgi:hypothetical protein